MKRTIIINQFQGGIKMVRKWYNTNVQRVSAMMDIDDDYILLNSKGEVSGVFDKDKAASS